MLGEQTVLRSAFLGLEPAWTRVTKLAVAAGCVAVALGCDFRHYDAVSDAPSIQAGAPNAGVAGATNAGRAGVSANAGLAGVSANAGRAGVSANAGLAGVSNAGIAGAPNAGLAGVSANAGRAGVSANAGLAGVSNAGIAGAPNAGVAGVAHAGIAGAPNAGVAGATVAGAVASMRPCPGKPEAQCEPACVPLQSSTSTPTPVAHWTFDGDGSSPEKDPWADAMDPSLLLIRDEGTAPTLSRYPRINGNGNSLHFDGNTYARVEQDPLSGAADSFTISLWISLERSTWLASVDDTSKGFTWTILSTFAETSTSSDCWGYQLDLRRESAGSDFQLVFSYKGGSQSKIHEVRYPLQDKPSWSWQAGTWHHVAVTRRTTARSVYTDLYWDSKPTVSDYAFVDTTNRSGTTCRTASPPLRVGGGPGLGTFTGYLDEISLFNVALTQEQLSKHVWEWTTRSGPSGCRWRTMESWDDSIGATASTSSWANADANNGPAVVDIHDQDWGAGSIQAFIPNERWLRNYRSLHLQASIPVSSAFQLTLADGDTYCSWVAMGQGNADLNYEFDLTKPMNCVSQTCDVPLWKVETISIASEWATPCAAQSSINCPESGLKDATRPFGLRQYEIFDIWFEPGTKDDSDWSAYAAAPGPFSGCWRVQAFEPGARASFADKSGASWQNVGVEWSGPAFTGCRLVVDFGDRGRDLSNFDGFMISSSSPSSANKFVIQDVFGSWGSGSLKTCTDADPNLTCSERLKDPEFSSARRTGNFKGFRPAIAYQRIRYLGIQKDWTAKIDVGMSQRITIDGILFTSETQ